MLNVVSLRGSLFCAPIRYDRGLVSAFSEILTDCVPVIVRDNVIPSWQLVSSNEKEILAFVGDKIDYVKKLEGELNSDILHDFCHRCQNIFGKIMEISKFPSMRIALAPSLLIADEKKLNDKVFSIVKFEDVDLATSNFSQVYRIDKEICSKKISINFASNFRVEPEVVIVDGKNQLRDRYLGDFDINTAHNPNYRFGIDDIKEFFQLSSEWFLDFYRLYFSEEI